MNPARPWVPYVAMVMLAGLLITAYFARGNGSGEMSIAPDPVMPGREITVRFAEPQVTAAELRFEGNGAVHSLRDNQWTTEVTDGTTWILDFGEVARSSMELLLPPDVEPGSYRVCATTFGGPDGTLASAETILDDIKQLCTDLEVGPG